MEEYAIFFINNIAPQFNINNEWCVLIGGEPTTIEQVKPSTESEIDVNKFSFLCKILLKYINEFYVIELANTEIKLDNICKVTFEYKDGTKAVDVSLLRLLME